MQGVLHVSWRVRPLTAPQVWRHCDRCKQRTPFGCSGKFRSNAHRKRIDVWLIYRCVRCDATWNCPIHERRNVADFDPASLQGFAENSAALLRRYAFDLDRLRRFAEQVEAADEVAVEKAVLDGVARHVGSLVIAIALTAPCALRLERLLARELGLSRGALQALHQAETLVLSPSGRRPLRQPLRDGQTVTLRLERLPALADSILEKAIG